MLSLNTDREYENQQLCQKWVSILTKRITKTKVEGKECS